MTDTDDEVFERRLDWALAERDGREAPDVADSVMARLDAAPARRRPLRSWLAAALVLFGASAVIAVFWLDKRGEQHEAGRQVVQDPERQRLQDMPYAVVRTPAEIRALPQDTQGVELVGMGFDGVAALIERCPWVRKLRLRGDEIEGGTIFRALWLRHLRHLDIQGCVNAPPRVVAEMAKDTALLQVRFGGQDWLTFEHLELLAKNGIQPILDDGHPLALPLATLICDHGEKMRERQLRDIEPIRFITVRSIADIAALPADTDAVDGLDLMDGDVGALARLKHLRHLRLRSGAQTKVIPVLDLDASYPPRTSDANRRSVTDAGLAQLVPLKELETLELAGTIGVRGPGLEHLARLPKLTELALICIDTDGEGLLHLPEFPALERLRLERNHGFGVRGMRAVARCEHLTGLVITACPQITAEGYLALRDLGTLRELRVRQAGPDTWRNDSQRKLTPEEEVQREVMRSIGHSDRSHVDDGVITGIAGMQALETLELTFTAGTDAGFAKLGQLGRLESLGLAGNERLTVDALKVLPRGLRELDVSGCTRIDDTIGAVVRARFPELEALRICNNEALTDLDDIAEIATLRVLEVRGCPGLGEPAAAALRRCDHLRALDYTLSPGVPAEVADYLRERGVSVKQKFW